MDTEQEARINHLTLKLSKLCYEISEVICHEGPDSARAVSLLGVQRETQRHIDFLNVTTSHSPPIGLNVFITTHPDDEPVELHATLCDKDGYRIDSHPIELTPIVRAIDAELDHFSKSGTASFYWRALPEDLHRATSQPAPQQDPRDCRL